MERLLVLAIALGVAAPLAAAEEPAFKSQKEKTSYALGVNIGKAMKQNGMDVDLTLLLKGIEDARGDGKLAMTDAELAETIQTFQQEMAAKQGQKLKGLADKNKAEGDTFLAENKKKEGVTTLPSGLQYKVLKTGTGKSPKADDTVVTHYRGTLIDGTEFDSSIKRGEPATFGVKDVIPAWTEALQRMKVGDKWQLFVPPDLAYGERGAGHVIGPNATLIFEVELLEIK
jgi:FKBP-type peptidyl-prolyl cis-trans isomerase FklB